MGTGEYDVTPVVCTGCGGTYCWERPRVSVRRRGGWRCSICKSEPPRDFTGRGPEVDPGNFSPRDSLPPGTLIGGQNDRLAVVVEDGHWSGYGWITVRFLDLGPDAPAQGAIKRFFRPFRLTPPEISAVPENGEGT